VFIRSRWFVQAKLFTESSLFKSNFLRTFFLFSVISSTNTMDDDGHKYSPLISDSEEGS
jgi:hypothetical protein